MKILKTLRAEKKISQEKLAEYLHISRSTLAMWETNASEPDMETIVKLANYFNVSTDYLLGNTKNLTPADNSHNNSPLSEIGSVEWFKQGLVKYGIVKAGEDLTDAQLQFLLENVSLIAEQLKNKQFNNNDK